MKTTLKLSKIACLSILLIGQCTPVFAEKVNQTNTVTHYLAHTISQGLCTLGALGVSGVGSVAGLLMISATGMDTHRPNRLLAAAGLTSLFGSLAASSYIVYKAPQWTDTYWLGYKSERTTKQNIISFVSKIISNIFVIPVGICAGEFIAHLDGFSPKVEETDTE